MEREMPDLFADISAFSPVAKTAPAPGEMKIRLGTGRQNRAPVFWKPDDADYKNICLLGGQDTGKSQLIKSLVVQLLRQRKNRLDPDSGLGILVLDYKGDYHDASQEFLDETGARVLELHNLFLNPFALRNQPRKPQLHVHTAMAFADAMTLSYGLDPIQKSTLVQSVMAAYADCGITSDPETWEKPAPSFADVHEAYCTRPSGQHNDSLEGILESLAAMELFEEDTRLISDRFRHFRGIAVVDLSGYPASLQNLAAMLILEQFSAQMYQSELSPNQLKKLVLVDEADDILLRHCPVLDRLLLEGSLYGVGVVLSARYPDCLWNLDPEARELLKRWVIHNTEDLTRMELIQLLDLDGHDGKLEQMHQTLRKLKKHQSVYCEEGQAPVEMENLPFFEISGDFSESYLRQPVLEAEELLQNSMPELDIGHLMLADISEDVEMEPLDMLLEME